MFHFVTCSGECKKNYAICACCMHVHAVMRSYGKGVWLAAARSLAVIKSRLSRSGEHSCLIGISYTSLEARNNTDPRKESKWILLKSLFLVNLAWGNQPSPFGWSLVVFCTTTTRHSRTSTTARCTPMARSAPSLSWTQQDRSVKLDVIFSSDNAWNRSHLANCKKNKFLY